MSPPAMSARVPLALSEKDRSRVAEVEELARGGEETLPRLFELLEDSSWAVRRAVVAALARRGSEAVPGLCAVLEGKRDNETRLAAAVDTLVLCTGCAVAEAMMRMAEKASRPAIACDALQVLGRRKETAALPLLAKYASHQDDNVAVAAIEALGRIGDPVTVDPLLAAVRSKNFFRTFPAIDALGRTGDARAVGPLVALLDDPLYASEATRTLGHSGQSAALPALAALLSRPNDVVVRAAAMALSEFHDVQSAKRADASSDVGSLRDLAPGAHATTRLIACMTGATPPEQNAIVRVLGWLAHEVGVLHLIELLDAEPGLVRAAGDALRSAGSHAMPLIVEALRQGDSSRRARLLPLVGSHRSVIEDVTLCLHDADPTVRALACEALGRAGNPAVVPSLFQLIADSDPRVSQAASAAIQALGSVEAKRLALEEARSADARVRRAALRIVSYFGYPEALDILIGALDDPDDRTRDAAIVGLPLIRDARATKALVQAATSGDAKARSAAIRSLGRSPSAPEVVAALSHALGDDDAWVRYYACQAMAKLHVGSAVPKLVELTADAAGQVRVAAVEALAHLPGEASQSALVAAAKNADADIRRAAITGLGVMRDPATLPVLREAAEAPDPATRLVAVSALAEFPTPEIVPLLTHAASDPSDAVRSAAIGFLSTRSGDAATQALVDLLTSPAVRERAVAALSVPVDGRTEVMLAALDSADEETARLLVRALVRMRRASGHAAVAAALSSENVHARRAAANALASLATPESLEALRRCAASDLDEVVREIGLAAVRS